MTMEKISDRQRRKFFALCTVLGIDGDEAKNRGKALYQVEHMKDLTMMQAESLIKKLEDRIAEKMMQCPNCLGTGYIKKETLEQQGEIE